jgi:hypothetical protein
MMSAPLPPSLAQAQRAVNRPGMIRKSGHRFSEKIMPNQGG